MKPRIFIDVKNRQSPFTKLSRRINLNNSRIIFIPLKNFIRAALIILIVFSFVFGSVRAPIHNFLTKAAQTNNEERVQLEAQLAELESQISQYEATIEQYKTKGKTLQSEINRLNDQIAKLNLQIKAVTLNIQKLDREIDNTQSQINHTEKDIDFNKRAMSEILQNIYENEAKSLIEVLLANPKLSDFFGDLNNLLAFQDNLRVTLQKVQELRQELVDQKELLGLERADKAVLKTYQDSQKLVIQKTKEEKNNLLLVTKGQESKYQQLLTETKKTAAEVRKQIFKLIGGGELNFEDAYALAKFAEQATGVRAALILAVLDKESALGKNVGQCDYKTAMHPTRDIPIFLEIAKELDLIRDLESGVLKVSCPNSDGAFGGAMGPAQFIPSTWNLYKDRVSEITGNKPANPWNNTDAFMATALYLKDAGAGGASLTKEREAAARYYAGSRWRNYLWTYGARVIAQARKFEEDIAILSS